MNYVNENDNGTPWADDSYFPWLSKCNDLEEECTLYKMDINSLIDKHWWKTTIEKQLHWVGYVNLFLFLLHF